MYVTGEGAVKKLLCNRIHNLWMLPVTNESFFFFFWNDRRTHRKIQPFFFFRNNKTITQMGWTKQQEWSRFQPRWWWSSSKGYKDMFCVLVCVFFLPTKKNPISLMWTFKKINNGRDWEILWCYRVLTVKIGLNIYQHFHLFYSNLLVTKKKKQEENTKFSFFFFF